MRPVRRLGWRHVWGGIALGTLAGVWRLRRAGVSVTAFMDAAAPALLVGQAIGRVGNYFNQELFGGPTGLPWALQISPAHRPIGYESFATFHPTFLYELVWNLALAAFLVWLGHHRRIRPPGLFALYVAGYSAFRIFEESLRVDPAHHILGLRLNFYVAALLCLAGLLWFARSQGWQPGRRTRRGAALVLAGGIVLMSGCGGSRHANTSRTRGSTGRPVAVEIPQQSEAGGFGRSYLKSGRLQLSVRLSFTSHMSTDARVPGVSDESIALNALPPASMSSALSKL